MKKIIVTVGISNSGKSTWAAEQVQTNINTTVLVNRDKIRELLFGYTETTVNQYYLRTDLSKLEKQVTKYEDTLIHEALTEGKTVIVDATHLDSKYIERYRFWNVTVELKFFDITLKEALTRNLSRTRQVDEEIIKKQYSRYVQIRKELENIQGFGSVNLVNNSSLEPCFLIDIDGTLAHMSGRSPYEWNKVGEDYVDVAVKHATNSIFASHRAKIFICTGRDGVCLKETIEWLDEHDICYDKIFIRKEGDMRPDWVVKEEMWRQIAKDNYILGLIDDRLQVVRRARSLGLKVFNVEYNNF